jgi:hypothetical protein
MASVAAAGRQAALGSAGLFAQAEVQGQPGAAVGAAASLLVEASLEGRTGGLRVLAQALYDRIEWYPGCGDVFALRDWRYGDQLLAAGAKIMRGQAHGLVLTQSMQPRRGAVVSVAESLTGEDAGQGVSGDRGEYQTGLPYARGRVDHDVRVERQAVTNTFWSRKRTRAAFRAGSGGNHRAIEVDSVRGWLHVGDLKRIKTYSLQTWTLAFESADYNVDEWHGLRVDQRAGKLAGCAKHGSLFEVWVSDDGGETAVQVLTMTATSAAIEWDSERNVLVAIWENGAELQRQESLDAGETWSSAQAISGMSGTVLDMSHDHRSGQMQMALLQSGSLSIWSSDDLGLTWVQRLT